jgi:hypothetical protein
LVAKAQLQHIESINKIIDNDTLKRINDFNHLHTFRGNVNQSMLLLLSKTMNHLQNLYLNFELDEFNFTLQKKEDKDDLLINIHNFLKRCENLTHFELRFKDLIIYDN